MTEDLPAMVPWLAGATCLLLVLLVATSPWMPRGRKKGGGKR